MIRKLIFIILFITNNVWAAETIKCNESGNQAELNACAADDFTRADKELNETYRALITKEAKNQIFITKLRAAQRAWVTFRDAELEAAFACEKDNPRLCWGSMYPMRFAHLKADLTTERSKRLKQMLQEFQAVKNYEN